MNIEEMKRLAEAATPGPWMHLFGDRYIYDRMNDGCRGNPIVGVDYCSAGDRKNLDYVAAANPAAVLELIAEVERITKQRDELLAAMDAIIALPSHPMRKKAVDIAVSAKAKAEG